MGSQRVRRPSDFPFHFHIGPIEEDPSCVLGSLTNWMGPFLNPCSDPSGPHLSWLAWRAAAKDTASCKKQTASTCSKEWPEVWNPGRFLTTSTLFLPLRYYSHAPSSTVTLEVVVVLKKKIPTHLSLCQHITACEMPSVVPFSILCFREWLPFSVLIM